MFRAIPLVLLALAGCRSSTPPKPTPTASWEAPLVPEAASERLGAPLVELTIGGQTTRFIVDTGARETVLYAWFAKALGEVRGGRTVELPLSIGGVRLADASWPVVDTPPLVEALRVGGALSPQQLVREGAIVLDGPRQKLVAVPGAANAWLRWLDERSPNGRVEALPLVGPVDGTPYVMTRVGDGREVVTALRTSSRGAEYLASLFDASLVMGGQVKGLHVRVGETEFGPLDVAAKPGLGAHEGVLGMDVLEQLVVLLPAGNRTRVVWVLSPRE